MCICNLSRDLYFFFPLHKSANACCLVNSLLERKFFMTAIRHLPNLWVNGILRGYYRNMSMYIVSNLSCFFPLFSAVGSVFYRNFSDKFLFSIQKCSRGLSSVCRLFSFSEKIFLEELPLVPFPFPFARRRK